MQTKAARLAELDAEFNSQANCDSGAMQVAEWQRRRSLLEALPNDPKPAPEPKPQPAPDREHITMGFFTKAMEFIVDKLGERFAGIDKRIAALEEQSSADHKRAAPIRWRGTWKNEEEYSPADVLTHDGGLWYVHAPVSGERPGTTKKIQLMVKSHR